jgi:P pilus assembly chaperone PapD
MPSLRPASSSVRALLSALALLVGATRAQAVTVSPTALYISARNPSGLLTLINSSARAEEIEIGFGFGYAHFDTSGAVRVTVADSAPGGEPAATAWLRAFPRRLLLQPGQRQVVRITVVAPAGLTDGEFWGRVLIKSRGGEPPIEQTQGQVRMQLNVETTFATAVFFQKGALTTAVHVDAAAAQRMKDGVQFTIDLTRTGNAAYLGRVHAEVVDAAGQVWASDEDVTAVYRGLRRRFLLKGTTPMPAGQLHVRYVVDTDRPDLPSVGPVHAPSVTGTIPVS